MALTNKIQDYQKIVIKDRGLEQLKTELQELTEKLVKTESNLIHEKEERIKLEKRMENMMKIRDKELQQNIKEELEELKFVHREREIEKTSDKSDLFLKTEEENFAHSETYENQMSQKSKDVRKIEEIIAIQAKEMMKLGNNFERLVSHLTDSSDSASKEKLRSKLRIDLTETKNDCVSEQRRGSAQKERDKFQMNKTIASEVLTKVKTQAKEPLIQSDMKNGKNLKKEEPKMCDQFDPFEEIKNSLNEKFVWLGIDINADRLTEQEFSSAMTKISNDRLLAIQQNRHDFNYEAIEQQIKRFVDKKVNEMIGKTPEEYDESVAPKPKERKRSLEKTFKEDDNKESPLKQNQQSVEAIVHSLPNNETRVESLEPNSESDSDTDLDEESVAEDKIEEKRVSVVTPVVQPVVPKSVLKPIISQRQSDDIRAKGEQKRIRFSEHRIEYQLSSDESSEDTSEEYDPGSVNLTKDLTKVESTSSIPVAAQRTKRDSTIGEQKTYPDKDINDYRVNEIADQNESALHRPEGDWRQTKVQELAEMIEKQLNRRSSMEKRPPVGSVDVMNAHKESEWEFDRD